MNRLLILFLFASSFVCTNGVNGQIELNELSPFWRNTGIIGKYKLKINNPEIFGIKYDPSSGDISGTKIYEIPGYDCGYELTLWFALKNREYAKDKTGVFTSIGAIDPYFGDPPDYSIGSVACTYFFINQDYDLIVLSDLRNTNNNLSEADYQNFPDKKTFWKQADNDLTDFILSNVIISRVGESVDALPDNEEEYIEKDGTLIGEGGNLETATWVKVVGGAAALAGTMFLVAKIFNARLKKSAGKPNRPQPKKANKQQKEKKQKEEDEEKFFYILQLNKDVLEIGPEKTDKLVVTAWRVDSAGNRVLAKDATFQVSTTETNLAVSSSLGSGQCVAALSLKPSGQFKEAVLTIKAMAGGKALKASAKAIFVQQLTLIVDGPTPITFINGKKYQEALFERQKGESDGEWVFKPFFLWFTDDPNPSIDPDRTKPVNPPFKPIFKIEAMPDVLEISTPVYQGDNVWKADVKLFAEKSVDTNWLFTDGKIKIDVTVEEQNVN